tara:strand:+ start:1852 stop:2121 length:270 start_codon:yes stop_codon:yes gene_type:complete
MKTLTKNNLSLYLLEDDENVVLTPSEITIGDPPRAIIQDCSSEDTVLHEGVTAPDDWREHKYTYDGTTWTPVDGWKSWEELFALHNNSE